MSRSSLAAPFLHPEDAPEDGAWIAHSVPQPGARLRLFCLPHAAGSASLYRGWTSELGPDVEVCPLQLPGREGRIKEQPFMQIEPLVQELARVIGRRTDKPFALFGHSMGALVSFELARELRRVGLSAPVHLFVASYCAPHALGRPITVPEELDAAAAASVQQAHALSSDMAVEMVGVMRAAFLADKSLCEGYRYVPGEPLDCPISAFRGSEDYVQPSQMEAWRELTRGPFSTRAFLGDHFFLRDTPRGLQQAIRRTLTPRGTR